MGLEGAGSEKFVADWTYEVIRSFQESILEGLLFGIIGYLS